MDPRPKHHPAAEGHATEAHAAGARAGERNPSARDGVHGDGVHDDSLPGDGVVPLHAIVPLRGRTVMALALVSAALAAGMFVLGWIPHREREAAAATAAADAHHRPVVEVVVPRRAPDEFDLTLPGDVRANQATAVYARTTGYLKPLPPGIDIGARVRGGQLLAELYAPELDADVERARAAVGQANAAVTHARDDLAFQKATYERYQGFATTGGLTTQQLEERRQQFDTATTSLQIAEANARAAVAEQQRLEELQKYERVTAPFDGVLTFRGYDAGALISLSEIAAGKEMFRIAATDVLRVRVGVPQAHAGAIKVGQRAELTTRSQPGRMFAGTVARTAGAIDSSTRMMTAEIDVPNPDGALMPGAYGTVRLRIQRAQPMWLIPTSAVTFGSEGTRIAVLDGARVHFRRLAVDDDHGSEAEVANGLDGSERIVNNPGQNLAEGIEVEVHAPPHAGAQNKQEPAK
jgi:RND family efflux transporter MFP subunit